MDIPQTPMAWAVWFYATFIKPLVDICQSTDVLGYSLFDWLMSLGVLSLAVTVICGLFAADRRN